LITTTRNWFDTFSSGRRIATNSSDRRLTNLRENTGAPYGVRKPRNQYVAHRKAGAVKADLRFLGDVSSRFVQELPYANVRELNQTHPSVLRLVLRLNPIAV
jgi:hypothetical protein